MSAGPGLAPKASPATRLGTALTWAAIGILALGLRTWGIGFGVDLPRGRPDEELYLGPALGMFEPGFDPGLLGYGFTEGFALLVHWALRLQAALLEWRHGMEVNLGCLFALQPGAVLSTSRHLSVLFGVATLVPCAAIAQRLVTPERAVTAAKVAALLLAVNYLHGRDSHFGVPDAALTFALTAAMAHAVRLVDEGGASDALACGAFTGLSVALKWTGLFMLPVLVTVLAIAFARRRDRRIAPWPGIILGTMLFALGVFVLLDPRVPSQSHETLRGILSHTMRYGDQALLHLQDPSVKVGSGWWFHSRVTLPIAFGRFGFVMAGVGLVLVWIHRPAVGAVCTIFLAALFGVAVGPTRLLFVRYCMPVVPVLAALAAAGLILGVETGARWLADRRLRGSVLALAVIAAALPPMVRLVEADLRLARPDTRTLSAEWIRAHAAPEETVVPLVGYSGIYALPAEGLAACGAVLPAALRAPVATLPAITVADWPRWTGAVTRGRPGWGAVAERALLDYWNMPGVTPAHGDYVAYGQPLLSCGKPSVVRGLTPPDPSCFDEVARFSPGTPSCAAVYDLFDQFYLPYAGFEGIDRPGPEVVVYRNHCPRAR